MKWMESIIYVPCQLIRRVEDLILVEARPSLFGYVERHGLLLGYRRFGTNIGSIFKGHSY
jgi:hypothetical protein